MLTILRYALLFIFVACLINIDHLAYPDRTTVKAIVGKIDTIPLRTATLRLISPLATPATLRPIPITTTAQLPKLPQDLLFANDRGLLRWLHTTQFALQLYDLQTQQLTTVLTTTSGVLSLAIAPDATWIAYSLQTRAQRPHPPWWYRLLHDHSCGCGGDTVVGMIYAMRLQPPYQPMQLGSCSEFAPQVNCFGLVLWPVGQKQWRVSVRTALVGYTQEHAHLVALPKLAVFPVVSMSPFTRWSQLDRFVPLWTHPYPQLGDGILDTQTARVATFPQIVNGDNHLQRVTLLKHNQVLVLYPALTMAEPHPSIEQWSIHPEGEPFLKLTQQLSIPVNWDNYPGTPYQLSDGRIALALFNSNFGPDPIRGLYLLDHDFTVLRQVNRLPRTEASGLYPIAEPLAGDLVWLPDGTGALYVASYLPNLEQTWYLPFDGSPPLDLQIVLGKQPWGFSWLP